MHILHSNFQMLYSYVKLLSRNQHSHYVQLFRLSQRSIIYRPIFETLVHSKRSNKPFLFYCRTLCTKTNPDYVSLLNAALIDDNEDAELARRCLESSKHQEKILQDFLSSKDTASVEDWKCILDKVFELKFGQYTDKNIDGKVIELCVKFSKLDLARSYLLFMKSQKKKLNAAVVSGFVKLCYVHKKSLTDHDKQRVAQFTDFLVKKYGIFGSNFCDGIIQGLLLQNKVNDAVSALNMNDEMNDMSESSYSHVILGLLEDDQINEAVRIIECMFAMKIDVPVDVYFKWIEIFKHDMKMIEKMLYWFNAYDIKPLESLCDALKKAIEESEESQKFACTYGSVTKSGICNVCHRPLQSSLLSVHEFNYLKRLILSKVLVKDDVFKSSHPLEIEKFFIFVKQHAPFDIVIDLVNFMYISGKIDKQIMYQRIRHLIQHFKKTKKKMLFIVKGYLCNWPNFLQMLRELDVSYFYVDNASEDDAFVLYATIYSGLQCQIVTRDKMRTENLLLPSQLDQDLFKRWYLSHRIVIDYISKFGSLNIIEPITFSMKTQANVWGGWHVPYHNDDMIYNKGGYFLHEKWMCIKPCKNI